MKFLVILALSLLSIINVIAQELYVFSDPASNLPAKSLSVKIGMRLADNNWENKRNARFQPEISAGLSKHLMVRVSTTISDFYSVNQSWESVKGYLKWRFYSRDEIHRHFRMAAFVDGAYANHDMVYEEMNLDGDNSGIQAGIIGTQLINKLAISGTLSVMRALDPLYKIPSHRDFHDQNSLNYSLSAGYLLFPREYASYDQVNLNLYLEFLGMKGLDQGHYYLDIAPALQLIIKSATKINLGARFETTSDIDRLASNNYYLSVETSFLNLLPARKK